MTSTILFFYVWLQGQRTSTAEQNAACKSSTAGEQNATGSCTSAGDQYKTRSSSSNREPQTPDDSTADR